MSQFLRRRTVVVVVLAAALVMGGVLAWSQIGAAVDGDDPSARVMEWPVQVFFSEA